LPSSRIWAKESGTAVSTHTLTVKTRGFCDVIDLTDRVQDALRESGMEKGIATVFICGSTAGVTTIEYEPGAIADLQQALARLAPEDAEYRHNEKWHDGNGFSHLRSALIKTSLTVPFAGAKLLLGTWQQVVLLDFDNRPRNRKVIVQILGE